MTHADRVADEIERRILESGCVPQVFAELRYKVPNSQSQVGGSTRVGMAQVEPGAHVYKGTFTADANMEVTDVFLHCMLGNATWSTSLQGFRGPITMHPGDTIELNYNLTVE